MLKTLSTILFVFINFSFLAAQTDIFSVMDSTFNAEIEDMMQEYNDTIRSMDEEFYRYLGQDWDQYLVSEGLARPAYTDMVEDAAYTPQYFTPISYAPRKATRYITVPFSFYEKKFELELDIDTKLKLSSISENAVSMAWRKMAATDYYSVIKKCNAIKADLQLNDWGLFLLLEKMSQHIFTQTQHNERAFFIVFILNHMGYDTKMARSEAVSGGREKLLMLLPFRNIIYKKDNIPINDKTYYIETIPLNESVLGVRKYSNHIYSYQKNFVLAKNGVDLYLNHYPLLGETLQSKMVKAPWKSGETPIRWRKGLGEFYESYPNTVLSVYFNTAMSSDLKKSLLPLLEPLIAEKDEVKAVQQVMDWFHKSFAYKQDEKLYGYQRIFFPEQMFLNTYNDCEDRAILFAHIIKEFIGLDVVLFV